jgi:hypothetical protein
VATSAQSPASAVRGVPWKQAVADCVLGIVNRKGSPDFALQEVYAYSRYLAAQFPNNRFIDDKIRQILQQLRDDGLIVFHGGARYSLNAGNPEVVVDLTPLGNERPGEVRTRRTVRLRSTLLATEMKRLYRFKCQVCRQSVVLSQSSSYAEAHHLKPLGEPHQGPDVVGNIIVVCPNHHTMLDRGAIQVAPRTLEIRHRVSSVFEPGLRLHTEPWHRLDAACLDYHMAEIYAKAALDGVA